jgi:hypothetical protein
LAHEDRSSWALFFVDLAGTLNVPESGGSAVLSKGTFPRRFATNILGGTPHLSFDIIDEFDWQE